LVANFAQGFELLAIDGAASVRGRLEDGCIYRKDGWRRARGAGEQITRILGEFAPGIATPAEARRRLALKGGDQVGF
jgi:hypothetical protein